MATKPHTICHMVSSVDGRTLGSRWRPEGIDMAALFEGVHDRLGGGSWIVGRVTGQEFAKGEGYPTDTGERHPREAFIATPGAKAYGIVLDAHGKIAWGRADVGGDPIVVVLSEEVSDDHLAGLRRDGVSYVFAGRSEIDLARALEVLAQELSLEHLLIEGGGGANGAFLRAGLVDEISVVIAPAVDGGRGAPSTFDSSEEEGGDRPPVRAMTLTSHEVLERGAVWLRYRIENHTA